MSSSTQCHSGSGRPGSGNIALGRTARTDTNRSAESTAYEPKVCGCKVCNCTREYDLPGVCVTCQVNCVDKKSSF
jgi:hypothetical protein